MKTQQKLVAAALAALSCSACMVGPDYEEAKLDSQDQWSSPESRGVTASRPADLDSWWTQFNDLKLNDLVDRAIRNNLDYQIAESRVREARAAVTLANSGLYPQIAAGGSYSRNRTSINGSGGFNPGNIPGFDRDFNLWQVGFDAAWEIDVFGGVRRLVEAAVAEEAATIEDRRAVLVTLLGEVGRNYVEYREFRRQVVLSNDQLRSQQRTVDLTRARVETGLGSELELAQALSEFESTRAQIPFFEAQAKESIHRLGVLLGEGPASLDSELAADTAIPLPPSSMGLGVPADLLRRRADIRRAERLVAAANARIGAAIAERYPKFTLTGSYGFRSLELNDLLENPSNFFSIIPGFSIPLFTGGRIDANIEIARAREEQALLSFKGQYLVALEEVENALSRYTREQARRDALAASVAAADRALQLARALFEQGLTDFLNVLITERALLNRQNALVQSEAQVTLASVALFKALGGGWETAEPIASRPAESDLAKTD
jgi:NodT family efflux transporter outer membrane factor (OMF) lipoprotein